MEQLRAARIPAIADLGTALLAVRDRVVIRNPPGGRTISTTGPRCASRPGRRSRGAEPGLGEER